MKKALAEPPVRISHTLRPKEASVSVPNAIGSAARPPRENRESRNRVIGSAR